MEPFTERHARSFLLTLVIIFLALTLLLLLGFAAPLVMGLILSGLSYPLFRILRRDLRSENLAAVLTLLVVVIIIVVPLVILGIMLFNQGLDLVLAAQERILALDAPRSM